MSKIRDLIEFEEVKDVIDIDSDLETEEGKKNIVKDYIISERLKDHLLDIAENVSRSKHKSIQIIGDYGSGKSHLLGWLVSLLENNELSEYISDEEVRNAFNKSLDREFAVVQFELQPGTSPLSAYFFDRVERQLKEKYDIEIPSRDSSSPEDFKRDINDILEKVKEDDSTRGFAVVIDEISDFLKQKTKQQINRDIQFLRVLGQVSQSSDFLLVGSMQENVFTDPKYIDEAESFGRVSERFDIVTIAREDIEKVISRRVLKKNLSQREKIDELLSEYKETFPPINSDPESYIDLFPVHPYVIEIFNDLPYFEKRGAIQFTMGRVKDILDRDFPEFITYDTVFDEMNSRHTIRNLDDVKPVIEAVETLNTKIDLLEERFQENARRLIKALAVLKLYGKTKNNGATPEELANELLITSNTIENTDRILQILNKVREVTSGQFIAKTEDDYFYLDLEKTIDYDAVIERKMKNLPDGAEEGELLKILKYTDLVGSDTSESYTRKFMDTCPWADKKSFRMGHFIFDDGSETVEKGDLDFNIVVLSPYESESEISSSKATAILPLQYDEEVDGVLKRLAAATLLIGENYAKSVMEKKRKKYREKAEEILLDRLINSKINIDGEDKKIKSMITKEPENIDEFFHYVKENTFNDYFSSKYSKYPKFSTQISHENIVGEVETTIKELLQKGEHNLFSNAKNILSSLDLLDLENNIDTADSIYAKVILDELEDKKGKNVKIKDLIKKLSSEPFGLNEEMTQLILVVLTYNGEIILRKRGGGTLTSSDLSDVFKSAGLKEAFKEIPYATLETEFPVESIVKLFRELDLNPGLVRSSKDRTKAVQEFREKTIEIEEGLKSIKNGLEDIKSKPDPLVDVQTLFKKVDVIDEFPIEDFKKVRTVNDFKKVRYTENELTGIGDKLGLMQILAKFMDDYNEFIYRDYQYVKNSLELVESHQEFFSKDGIEQLESLRAECKPIINEISKLLDHEQRRLLKGKLEQYKRKYIPLYYTKHAETVGERVDWDKLEKVTKNDELKKLRDMKAIRCINSVRLNKLENSILSLSEAKCTKLTEDQLKESYQCTWCKFPEKIKDIIDINNRIEGMEEEINNISEEWTNTILHEIDAYEDNIELLSSDERKIIKNIKSNGKLPQEIDQETISALNNLFSEISVVSLSPSEILSFVFSDSSVLDYESFSERMEAFREKLLEKGEKKNIRIKKGGE